MCLTTVPRELYEESEFVRGSDSDAVAELLKFMLELSSITKLGLDGAPSCSTTGLEYPVTDSAEDFGDMDGSERTALMVGVVVGKTIISSSEYSGSELSNP